MWSETYFHVISEGIPEGIPEGGCMASTRRGVNRNDPRFGEDADVAGFARLGKVPFGGGGPR